MFNKKSGVLDYQIIREGSEEIMKINYEGYPYPASIESNESCMADTIDKLIQVPSATRIILNQRRNYIYGYEQTLMLREIANIYTHLTKQKKVLTYSILGTRDSREIPERYAAIQYVVLSLLRTDPIGAYVELKRLIREEKIRLQKAVAKDEVEDRETYLSLLLYIYDLLDKTKLASITKKYIAGYSLGDRSLYRNIFRPIITPDFMFTRVMAEPPLDGIEIDTYSVDENTDVMIFDIPGDIKHLYHVNPPEFKISEESYELLDLAKNVLAEHKPRAEEFVDPEKMRQTFFNIGRDLITELAEHKGYQLDYKEIENLARILVRYTVGFGLVEVLLKDEKIQDINVNGPIGETPIFILHEDFEECVTNIIPSKDDGDSWATKFRIISGRPLDEANPVLDTELIVPGARARVAIISNPLNPLGLGYSIRRHRDKPWTLPLFIKNEMINPMAAGLLSFLIDGSRSLLIAGTRSSGKTSFLGACMVEIMRKYRMITVEDSVAGDSSIIIKKSDKFERTTIGELIDELIDKYGCWYNLSGHEILGNDEDIKVFAMDKKGKISLSRVSRFIRHKIRKDIFEITTKTGRTIKVTGDHSLFGINNQGVVNEVKVRDLRKNSFIAVPRIFPFYGKKKTSFNLIQSLDKLDKGYFVGGYIKEFLKKYKFEIKQLGREHRYSKSTIDRWFRIGLIPIKILKDLKSLGYNINLLSYSYFKCSHNSKPISVLINLDKDFLVSMGLWIADGCYDKRSVIWSVVEDDARQPIFNLARKFGFDVKKHSDNFSLMINSTSFKLIMRELLELKGNAYTKRIPEWVFNLAPEQITYFLKGIFSGDGCAADKEIVMPMASLGLLKDIQTLLLSFGVIFRISNIRKDKTYNASITSLKFWKIFREKINFLQKQKKEKLNLLCNKISTHDITDVIPLPRSVKKELKHYINNFGYQDYVVRDNNIGREKLYTILQEPKYNCDLLQNLRVLANSDIFWDQIKEIKKLELNKTYVYDLSIPECESFICENIIAHNTLELPVSYLRKLGYNIQPMKVRAALAIAGGSEVAADEGIRTSLRMGDSSLIVGEVRSKEALALYEAMRVGALANVVAGTIHGDSPYGVFDRVVNDLQVPRTSFKATDIIVIANPIKTADGLHKKRKIVSITEVRKEWEEDPLRERAFIDLMRYNTKTDQLEITEDLINGDSEIIKAIAANVKEWAGNWDAVWDNIMLRAKIKKHLVDISNKINMPILLEADFVIKSNDEFHKITDYIREKKGFLDSKQIFFEWSEWLKKEVKKITI